MLRVWSFDKTPESFQELAAQLEFRLMSVGPLAQSLAKVAQRNE